MKQIFFILLFAIFFEGYVWSQMISSSFDVRCFTKDSRADGGTDSKTEASVFGTEIVPDEKTKSFLDSIKAQPLPEVRERMLLEN